VAGIPLRRRLFALTAAGILPLAVMAGIGLYVLAWQQRAQAQRAGLELARSVGTAIDTELQSTVATLQALATTLTLDRGDLAGFRERAGRVLALETDWRAIVLADPAGAPLLDTRQAAGAVLPPIEEKESFDRAVGTREPAIGNLARDAGGSWLFAVRVPVVRAGELRYVMTALVAPEQIRDVLTRQRVPGDWVISVVGGNGRRVARSRAHDQTLGGRLSESAQAVVARGGAEGVGIADTLEGERIFTPYSRLASNGWMAVLGIPTALVDAAVLRSVAVYGGGILLSLVLGTLCALWVARSISRPIADLRAAAEAVGRRAPPRVPATSIQEIRDVAAALTAAADELTRGEAERDDLLRKERKARETAEAADRAKDEFMAVLSHELRTPLNAVYGWARMLQSGQLRDPALVARAMDVIVRNSDIQVELIDDLLDLSRITTGKMRLHVRPLHLEQVLQGALDAVRPAADAKAIRIQAAIDADAGPVTGDPARLQQVVWNLLMNAVKFTPRDGRVELHALRAGSHVAVVVRDTGQGITPSLLPHVFERFRQADSSSTRAAGGLGLGLALVKHLVELHGGSVVAESAGPAQGATFTVRLPVALVDVPVGNERPARLAAQGLEPLPALARIDGVRVLVADDDREAVRLAQAILAGAGAEVRTCVTAADALEVLRAWRPDVLVSDVEMPGEDGYALIRKVRALAPEEGGRTPAVALTAYGRTQDRMRSLAAGYTMHVPKPVDPGELTAIVASLAGLPQSG
jgi:signal transduction histidine kinase/ActR/RegA family two-component response regulator